MLKKAILITILLAFISITVFTIFKTDKEISLSSDSYTVLTSGTADGKVPEMTKEDARRISETISGKYRKIKQPKTMVAKYTIIPEEGDFIYVLDKRTIAIQKDEGYWVGKKRGEKIDIDFIKRFVPESRPETTIDPNKPRRTREIGIPDVIN